MTIATHQPAHPPRVVSRTKVAPPTVTASTFIGTAQAKLSLGLTQDVPGIQTLQAAIAQGSANQVPASVTRALQAYLETPECATTIANARLVAQFTVANLGNQVAPVPALTAPAQPTDIAAAMIAAAALVAKQRKDTKSYDYGKKLSELISAFGAPEEGLAFEGLNELVYAIWGSEGTDVLWGPGPPTVSPFIQVIVDSVSAFGNSSGDSGGSGGSGRKPSDDDDNTTHQKN